MPTTWPSSELLKRVRRGENAANVIESSDERRSIDIFSKKGAPVVAVNDGVVKKLGRSKKLGRYVVLQDVYGNRYTYAHLGEVSKYYPVPKDDADADSTARRKAVQANGDDSADPQPRLPASAGRQLDDSDTAPERDRGAELESHDPTQAVGAGQAAPVRPPRPARSARGGRPRAAAGGAGAQERQVRDLQELLLAPVRPRPSKVRLRALKRGARVIGGTIIGRVGQTVAGKAAHLDFSIRPAGRGAPRIDPKPILDGWKLLEATAVYRASGRNVLYGDDEAGAMSIGQILLLPKPLLEKRVLVRRAHRDLRVRPDDIRSGQVDRRVLATLAYLAESGLKPDRHDAQVRPRLLHAARATSPTTPPATPSTSRRSTASRSSATRSRAA